MIETLERCVECHSAIWKGQKCKKCRLGVWKEFEPETELDDVNMDDEHSQARQNLLASRNDRIERVARTRIIVQDPLTPEVEPRKCVGCGTIIKYSYGILCSPCVIKNPVIEADGRVTFK